VKRAELSLSARVAHARRVVDEVFQDLGEAVEHLETTLRSIFGDEPKPPSPPAAARRPQKRSTKPTRAVSAAKVGGPRRGPGRPRKAAHEALRDSSSRRPSGVPATAAVRYATPAPLPAGPPERPLVEPKLKCSPEEARAIAQEEERRKKYVDRVRVDADEVL